jgi:hypothetical protein
LQLDLENFFGELRPEEDEFVKMQKENDGFLIWQSKLLAVESNVHRVLQSPHHGSKHDDVAL